MRYPEIVRIKILQFVLHWINVVKKYYASFLVHTFNVTLTLCSVKYMMISNIHNRTPKCGILFTDLCTKSFFNWHDFMKDLVVDLLLCFAILVNLFRINEDLIRIINCERRRSSFYMYIWNRLQRMKSLKMVVETWHKNQFSYFYALNLLIKLTRPYPTRQWMLFDGLYIGQYY